MSTANMTVRRFGDAIDTDIIIPARYLTSRDPEVLGAKCMEGLDPGFAERITRGDVIVAGRNFGCGSSREHAVLALQGAGVSHIIAASYARIFYRNAINLGFPVLVSPAAAAIAEEGQAIEIDIPGGQVIIDGTECPIEPFPEFLQEIIDMGGIVPFVRKRLDHTAAAGDAQ